MTADSAGRQRRFKLRAPHQKLLFLEARALVEASALIPTAPLLLSQPKGDGRQIVVLPGFKTDDRSTWPLRRFLEYLGYDAHGWGLGVNRGQPQADTPRFLEHLDSIQRSDEPITLIGWSLGGIVARLTAQAHPERVREIITMGTPVEGGPKYTRAGAFYAERRKVDLDAFEQEIHEVNSQGLKVPVTVIYSRTDAIVDWKAARDRYNAQAHHVEVLGSHLGLGVNPRVWRIIARTLAASRSSSGA